jgi:hypothetical protein
MEHTWQQRKKDQYGKESKRESKSELGLRAKRNAGMGARVGASLLSLLLAAGRRSASAARWTARPITRKRRRRSST